MNKLISKTYLWMSIGLLVTFLTGIFVANNNVMYTNIYSGTWYIVFAIVEIILVIFLSARVMRMKASTARCCFLLYSVVSGLTFSSIFIYYKISSIMFIFLITAFLFALLSFMGFATKLDLTKLGTYFLFGLLAVIVVSIINIILNNSMLDLIISIVIILLFIGITMYDVQKIKRLQDSGLSEDNLAIYGALDLYLDFINIFIHLLSIFGEES